MWNRDEKDSQFSEMIEARLSRRRFLAGSAAVSAGAFLTLNPVAKAVAAKPQSSLLNFEPVPASTADMVVVPKGYKATPLMSGATRFSLMHLHLTKAVNKIHVRRSVSLVITPTA